MGIYWKYLLYVLEHKKNVFKVCWKKGMYLHAFTHDLSKFHPKEFFAYANWFYGAYGARLKGNIVDYFLQQYIEIKFEDAWQHHKNNNKHHWDYWSEKECNLEMPDKYIKQMLCDWEAMSIKFGDTPKDYYLNNKDKIELHPKSRERVEELLGVSEEG